MLRGLQESGGVGSESWTRALLRLGPTHLCTVYGAIFSSIALLSPTDA